jgi:hypothetical protein
MVRSSLHGQPDRLDVDVNRAIGPSRVTAQMAYAPSGVGAAQHMSNDDIRRLPHTLGTRGTHLRSHAVVRRADGAWARTLTARAAMQDRVTTSWRRRSDPSTDPDGKRGDAPRESPMRTNAEKLETWEDEGGRTGRVSSEIMRILVVDNDMRSGDALELMLHAAGYPETRVAYSAHAALAMAAEFRPDVA